jgi:DNA polymerase-3 subunit delta'
MNIEPKNNDYLIGQEEAENFLLKSWKTNNLHNSWIFYGQKGIGKTTFAYKFAKFLLQANDKNKEIYETFYFDTNSNISKLVENGSHPDIKYIERSYTDTDQKKYEKMISSDDFDPEEVKKLKKSAIIKVDEIRKVNSFFSKTSSYNGWRIIIVDSVDDLNTEGANAILKILEEPPYKSIIILISHNINSLLPTIKSRCAKLQFKPLSNENLSILSNRYIPEINKDEKEFLLNISNGSIGNMINYQNHNGFDIYNKIKEITTRGKSFQSSNLLTLADEISNNENSYYIGKEMLLRYIKDMIENSEIASKVKVDIDEIYKIWKDTISIFNDVNVINMDKKQSIINIIYNLTKVF